MSKGEKWVIEGFHLYWDSFGQSHFANGELTCHMHTAIEQIEKVHFSKKMKLFSISSLFWVWKMC